MKQKDWKNILGDLESLNPERSIKVVHDEGLDSTVKELLKVYERITDMRDDSPEWTYTLCKRNMPRDKYRINNQIITQLAVQIFMYDAGVAFPETAGLFLTAAIQTSFYQGNNEFDIVLGGARPIHCFGRDLHGWPENRLRINVMDSGCSQNSSGWFAYAQNLDVKITAMSVVPQAPRNATMQIGGAVWTLPFSYESAFAEGAKRCRFGVDNEDVLKYLQEKFQYQENWRAVGKPYIPMPESEKSEAYLIETPSPQVILLDLDIAKQELAYLTA